MPSQEAAYSTIRFPGCNRLNARNLSPGAGIYTNMWLHARLPDLTESGAGAPDWQDGYGRLCKQTSG